MAASRRCQRGGAEPPPTASEAETVEKRPACRWRPGDRLTFRTAGRAGGWGDPSGRAEPPTRFADDLAKGLRLGPKGRRGANYGVRRLGRARRGRIGGAMPYARAPVDQKTGGPPPGLAAMAEAGIDEMVVYGNAWARATICATPSDFGYPRRARPSRSSARGRPPIELFVDKRGRGPIAAEGGGSPAIKGPPGLPRSRYIARAVGGAARPRRQPTCLAAARPRPLFCQRWLADSTERRLFTRRRPPP